MPKIIINSRTKLGEIWLEVLLSFLYSIIHFFIIYIDFVLFVIILNSTASNRFLYLFGINIGKKLVVGGIEFASVSLYYYLFLALVLFSILISHRLERSRIGRAWMAIREDEIAAKAMGINTRNLKLTAFGMGATFGGVSGAMFASFQGFISPESFSLMESVMIVAMVVLGGVGHLPGVVLGAVLLSALPEVLRYVAGPLQTMTDGRLDASILRQLLIAMAMVTVMLLRPRGLWPSPEHGKSLSPAGQA